MSIDEEVEGTVKETDASEVSWDTRGCAMTIERDQLGKSRTNNDTVLTT